MSGVSGGNTARFKDQKGPQRAGLQAPMCGCRSVLMFAGSAVGQFCLSRFEEIGVFRTDLFG